jgi:dTDP-4-dehydrorhamnose 3,5-epimerase
MRLVPTAIEGAFIVEPLVNTDSRGSFGRVFCGKLFADAGIDFEAVQINLSRNTHRHTLRGLHTQQSPHEEAKLVHCVRGGIFDVAIDLRPDSTSHGCVVSIELKAAIDRMFFIPKGCAHGFLTLEPDTDVLYYMGTAFVPDVGLGVRWNDPSFAIDWPALPAVISDRDASYPNYPASLPATR